MGFFQTTPTYKAVPNPYIGQLADQQYNFGPARKAYKQELKDPMSDPGLGEFAGEEASAYEQIRRRPHLQSGYSAAESDQYEMDRARQGIGTRRMAYVGQRQAEAKQGLADMFSRYNQFNLDKYSNAAGAYNNSIRDYTPRQGVGAGLIGSALQGASAVGAAFAGPHP